RGASTRVEVRCPDPACNPYLAFAMMLGAGLDGVRNKLEPPKSTDVNIFDMTSGEKEVAGIPSMPGSLAEALEEFEANPLGREILGPHIFEKYREAKWREWDAFRTAVTDWEEAEYLGIY
ncbi:MAG: type I glutamate--ammonia ligase, partial [Proteobacteria bacterium]|nr:type I glutamate--ammonia ligase [Pseudomonadota bacterium]